jgi:predicted N-acyltransferase
MRLQVIDSLSQIPEQDWNALVNPNDPFTDYLFLRALEDSASVGQGTGWVPKHVLCYDDKRLAGAIPLYLKTDSYGEYIFDWGWASAAQRAGIRYYPKLTSAIPFTPATGRRFLLHPQAPPETIDTLVQGIQDLADKQKVSSIHALFLTKEEQDQLTPKGFLPRLTYQFHWENKAYQSFDDFLQSFRSSIRKQTKKERRQAAASGLNLCVKTGKDLNEAEWSALYHFYRHTAQDKHAIPYLSKKFFDLLRGPLLPYVVASLGLKGDKPVAGSLAFQKGKHLYGRYWGCLESHEALHFELCYYQLIDFCITHQLTRFEAGAQGEHKLKRGFLPSATYSSHWIRHPGFSQAIADYLARETSAVQEEMAALIPHGPFHREGQEE